MFDDVKADAAEMAIRLGNVRFEGATVERTISTADKENMAPANTRVIPVSEPSMGSHKRKAGTSVCSVGASEPKRQKKAPSSKSKGATELVTDILGNPIKVDRAMDNFINAEKQPAKC